MNFFNSSCHRFMLYRVSGSAPIFLPTENGLVVVLGEVRVRGGDDLAPRPRPVASNCSSSVRSSWVAPRGVRPVFCLFLFAPTAGFIVFTVFTVCAVVVVVRCVRRRVFAESSFVSSSFGFDSEDDSDDDVIVVLAVDTARFAPTLVSTFAFARSLAFAAALHRTRHRVVIFRSIPASVLEIFSSMISSASSTTRSRFATASASMWS